MSLAMQAIDKAFGHNRVLRAVDFEIQPGMICALLGENGAGKSTLMNILGGVLQADAGEIRLGGEVQHFAKPADAQQAGIAFIHQELSLINDLTVYENLFLGREPKGVLGWLKRQAMIQESQALFARLGLDIDPLALLDELEPAYKQLVEIARAFLMQARWIIMDEPTTSLNEPEIQRVFAMMRRLASEGVGIVFISHKLREVMQICDRYTVLRDGVMVASGQVADTSPEELASLMVGHAIADPKKQSQIKLGAECLRVSGLSDQRHFYDISFSLRAGEVLGISGLLGDGRRELVQAIYGDRPYTTGEIFWQGQPCHFASPHAALAAGLAYVPRDRKENGIVPDMSIVENASLMTLRQYQKGLLLDAKARDAAFEKQEKALRIKLGSYQDPITSLSGGNQQKVVIAKCLEVAPKVLILDNPCQGVDVGAKEEIYDIISRLAAEGVGIIVLSSEAQEIIHLADRALVLYHGRLAGELSREEMTEAKMMALATGSLADPKPLSGRPSREDETATS